MLEIITGIDVHLMYFFNVTVHNPVFSRVMPLFHDGKYWNLVFFAAWLSLMIFGGRKGRYAGIGAILLVAVSDQVSSHMLKPLFARIRPCNVLGHLWLWKGGVWMMTPEPVIEIYKGSYSLPSSHASNTGAQAAWWSVLYPRTKWIWISLAVLIGYSRIYNGVHYPLDVVSGWCAGILTFLVFYYLVRPWLSETRHEPPASMKLY